MGDPCIICVAITGSLPTKANNPAVPITVSEQDMYDRERAAFLRLAKTPETKARINGMLAGDPIDN